MASDTLPEGTDHIINGAGVSTDDEDISMVATTTPPEADAASEAPSALFGRYEDLKAQAGDKAREFAQAGKDRATAALDDLVRMIEDAAGEVDGKLGSDYGNYARRAADGIGNFSEAFKDKDVDQIFDEARGLIKKSPTIAIGVAAALGFVVARIARAGIPEKAEAPADAPKNEPAA
jgi:ElaB/YqjD/DUF883 family membrane-anchored ribosome-binding protein